MKDLIQERYDDDLRLCDALRAPGVLTTLFLRDAISNITQSFVLDRLVNVLAIESRPD